MVRIMCARENIIFQYTRKFFELEEKVLKSDIFDKEISKVQRGRFENLLIVSFNFNISYIKVSKVYNFSDEILLFVSLFLKIKEKMENI